MSTSVGDYVVVTHVYHAYSILFMGFQTQVDLIVLDILDMTQLSRYYAILNFNAKTMTLEVLRMDELRV